MILNISFFHTSYPRSFGFFSITESFDSSYTGLTVNNYIYSVIFFFIQTFMIFLNFLSFNYSFLRLTTFFRNYCAIKPIGRKASFFS